MIATRRMSDVRKAAGRVALQLWRRTPRLYRLALTASLLSPAAVSGQVSPTVEAFAQQTPPPVPDYARASSWAARPHHPGAAANLPHGASSIARHPKVDVFYITPTTYLSMSRWNQDIADMGANSWTDGSVVARQASVFNGCCRVLVPRYRQASRLALAHFPGEGDAALSLAYSDVERAFDYYIAHYNKGRPFILAGHSQGALHLTTLLARRIDDRPLKAHMVAAYIVGLPTLAEGNFTRVYKTIPICEHPAQTGCAVGWNSVLPTVALEKAAAKDEQAYTNRFGDRPEKTILCVNPITFDRARPFADRESAKGAVPGSPDAAPINPITLHAVGARCEHGLLVVDVSPTLGLIPLANNSMHYHDFGMFYEDIRENAVLRSESYLQKNRKNKVFL